VERGYIKLWRRIQDSKFWLGQKFTKGQAWVDLLMLANHKDNGFFLRGIWVEVKRGQVGHSEKTLAARWCWSRTKTRAFILALQKEHQIEHQKSNLMSLITIINYNLYQEQKTAEKTPEKTPERHQKDTNKNDKNVKNDKKRNIYNVDFEKFYNTYPIKKSKKKAFEAWIKIKPDLDICLAAIKSQKMEKQKLKEAFEFCPAWKHPATWLNQGCWEDEIIKTEKENERDDFLRRHGAVK